MNPISEGPARPTSRDERGMALVIALLVLLVLTVIGAALMANVNIETKITGHKTRDTQAITIAEAGVQEAILRIRNGDVPDDLNARGVTLIYNQVAGSLPVSGTDTTSLATVQPAGTYLSYSSATKNNGVLIVKYRTKGSQIVRYDEDATPKINTTTGFPIWIITSTGRSGTASRTVYAEVTRSKINVLARAAVAADVGIEFKGNISICGHDHRMDTTVGIAPLGCDAFWADVTHASCLPGAWSSSMIDKKGSAYVKGEPADTVSYQTGFYSGPWDALGMLQTDFWAWVGGAQGAPAVPIGIYYVDNDALKQNASANVNYNGGDGEGFLYIDGDLHINGNFTFKGLIYCEGDLDINGDCWILGGLIVKGESTVKIANGSATILYSAEAIQQKISKYGGDLRTVAWHEL